MKKGTNLPLVFLNKKDNTFLGCLGLHKIDTPTPEISLWLKKEAWGRGFGFEGVQALVRWVERNLTYEALSRK